MITSFRHKGLHKLFETGDASGVLAGHKAKLRMLLTALNTATTIDDLNISGFKLHPLKGEMRNRWSISVSGNWRLTFEFKDGNTFILDYEDYH